MIKLLQAADLHLGTPFRQFPEPVSKALQHRQEEMLGTLLDLQLREGCQLVLLAGDLFESTVSRQLLERLMETLKAMAVPVFISPGNHDHLGPDSPYQCLAWPENVHIFTSPQLTSMVLEDLDLRIWGAGYHSMDCPPLLKRFTATGPEAHQIGLFHGSFTDFSSPTCPVTRDQLARCGLDYVALGHIHKGGKVSADKTLCAWPGGPMGRGFHEPGPKGVLVVDLPGHLPASARFVDLGLGQFREWTVNAEKATEAELLSVLESGDPRDAWRVTLTGSGPAHLSSLRDRLGPHCFHLELVDQTRAPADIWEKMEEDSLEGLYFRLLHQHLDRDRSLATLAAQLSWQILNDQEVDLP